MNANELIPFPKDDKPTGENKCTDPWPEDFDDLRRVYSCGSEEDQSPPFDTADDEPEIVDDPPCAEIMNDAPEAIQRPLCIAGGHAYLTTWVHLKMSSGAHAIKRVVLREDGLMFTDTNLPNALPLNQLGIDVLLPHEPDPKSVMGGPALKQYAEGKRVSPAEVFARVRKVVDYFMDFSDSSEKQADLVDLISLYVLAGYHLEAFSVVGYLWANGVKGCGKTTLLQVIANLAYMGVLVTSSGTFASLRDLSEYGATIGLDDAESMADKRGGDPGKREWLLSGNKSSARVSLKELCDGKWKTRFAPIFCPRMISAINLPNDTLASRTIIISLVRSADKNKANRDPTDYEIWPVDRRELVDDLWALGLQNLTKARVYNREVADLTSLTGRNLEPWRAVLAIALILQKEDGVTGLFERMKDLSENYQSNRSEIEEASPEFILVAAMLRLLNRAKSARIVVSPSELADEANQFAKEENLEYTGKTFTNAMKVGRLCKNLGIPYAPRRAGGKRLDVKRAVVDTLIATYGFNFPEENATCAGSASSATKQETPTAPAEEASDSASTDVSAVAVHDDSELELWRMVRENMSNDDTLIQ